MKKIIIIAYFFPPANFAGSYRIASWAKYLHRFGYYPIILTRCWNEGQTELTSDVTDNTFTRERHDGYEVLYVPYKNTIRDRLHAKYGDRSFVLLRKMFSLLELIFQNFSNAFIPYTNIYDTAVELIKGDSSIKAVLISGRPFHSYRFGYLLNKKFGIKWAPDYRDGWHIWNAFATTTISKMIGKLETRSELKWCSTASFFTATTDHIVEENEKILPVKGYKVMNGYDPDDYIFPDAGTEPKKKVTLFYNGTLYKTQNVESFITVFKELISEIKQRGETPAIELIFLGLASDPSQYNRVKALTADIAEYVKLTERVSKKEVIAAQINADVLLFFPHDEVVKGNYPSKIFEYFACEKPILFYPTDHDVMEQIIAETNTGISPDNKEDALNFLRNVYLNFKQGKIADYHPRQEKIMQYTRENQAKVLADILDRHV